MIADECNILEIQSRSTTDNICVLLIQINQHLSFELSFNLVIETHKNHPTFHHVNSLPKARRTQEQLAELTASRGS
jgi:hypothetical protein